MLSLLFVCGKSALQRLSGRVIWAFDGGDSTHVGVGIGSKIIDATAWHGVARWAREDWLDHYELIEEIHIPARSIGAEEQAAMNAINRIGQRYDLAELAGFLLLRDLGSPAHPVCSRLGYDVWLDATGYPLPDDRTGRIGPRLLRTHAAGYVAGLTSR